MLPDYIPPLPAHYNDHPWPSNVDQARKILFDLYNHALQALQTDSDHVRLEFHSNAVINQAFPLLLAFEEGQAEYPHIAPWIQTVTEQFIQLMKELNNAMKRPSASCVTDSHKQSLYY